MQLAVRIEDGRLGGGEPVGWEVQAVSGVSPAANNPNFQGSDTPNEIRD